MGEEDKLFKMKQDDWLEACKEIESLRAKLEKVEKLLEEIAESDTRAIAKEALAEIRGE